MTYICFRMRYLAAYLLATLGGKTNPSKNDVTKILESVGLEIEEDRLDKVFLSCVNDLFILLKGYVRAQRKGHQNSNGRRNGEISCHPIRLSWLCIDNDICSFPGGVAVASSGAPTSGGGGAEEKEEEKKEEKEESANESDDDMGFGLFD